MRKVFRSILMAAALSSAFFIESLQAAQSNFQVEQFTLPNGLKTLIQVDKRSPAVLVEVWYHVGSSDERLGNTGISHFLEHMMFQGTTTFPPGKLKELIAVNGGEENAFTYRDYTVYFELMSSKELPLMFELESDRMNNLSFTGNQFTSEKQVINEERRMRIGDVPLAYSLEQTQYASNVASPYAHPIIGWPSDLKQMTIRQLYNWYFKWYGPNNATLVIVGNVDPVQIKKEVEHYFGALKTVAGGTQQAFPLFRQTGQKELVIHRPGALPALIMTYRVPSIVSAKYPMDAYSLMVISDLLVGMNSSRLEKTLVRDEHIATGLHVSYNPFAKYDTNWTIIARPSKGVSLDQLQSAIADSLQQLAKSGPTKLELARVIKVVQAHHVFGLDQLSGQANILGTLDSVGLNWQLANTYLAKLGQVTPTQVKAVAAYYFNPDNLTVGDYYPSNGKPTYQSAFNDVVAQLGVIT